MKQHLQKYLRGLNILSEDEINCSLSFFSEWILKKGDFFITENKVCDKVAFIVKGGTKAFSTNDKAEENITCFKFENEFITSFESFMLRQPSKKSIKAIEDCDLLVIRFAVMNELLETIASWKLISKMLIEQELIDKEHYLINHNNKFVKEKYLHILSQSPEIVKRVKVSDLASYLGVTQRSLTRIRKEIQTISF